MLRLSRFLPAVALTVAALCAGPASAQFAVTVGADYGRITAGSGSGHVNRAHVDGGIALGLGVGGIVIEADGSYTRLSELPVDDATYSSFGGSLFWASAEGRIGATAGYNHLEYIGDGNVTNYGAFGEWFADDAFTLGLKGGGFSSNFSVKGTYAGGEVAFYPLPNIALNATVDYTKFNGGGNAHQTDFTVGGEWLAIRGVPATIYTAYTYTDASFFTDHINTWFVGIRLYFNDDSRTLVERHREGTTGWAGKFQSDRVFLGLL